VRQFQSGGAPPATIDVSDPSSLMVDMGVNSRRFSTSTVIARRTFRVEDESSLGGKRGETINIGGSFTTRIKDALVVVTTTVIPVHSLFAPIVENAFNRSPRTIGANVNRTQFFRPGKYTLLVTITYVNRRGFWDNNASGSPHRFSVSSL
jgi:hypothetical protein